MYSFHAMNTTITTFGLPQDKAIQVESWFGFVEGKLSRFRSDSELSALNRSQGNPFVASALLFEVMTQANTFYHETDGLFNPFMGHVIAHLGYDQSFEKIAEVYRKQREKLTSLSGHPAEMNPTMRSITLSPGVCVDFGGIAKGWSAHYISRMLKKNGARVGAIDAGGDIVVWGDLEEGWEVGIENPLFPEQDLLSFKVKNEVGIATSSTLKRRWKGVNSKECNHILDPRSVDSTDSDLVQVTVIAPDLNYAEVYAKCGLILGSKNGIAWVERRHPDFAVIAVRSDGSVMTGGNKTMFCLERSMNNG